METDRKVTMGFTVKESTRTLVELAATTAEENRNEWVDRVLRLEAEAELRQWFNTLTPDERRTVVEDAT